MPIVSVFQRLECNSIVSEMWLLNHRVKAMIRKTQRLECARVDALEKRVKRVEKCEKVLNYQRFQGLKHIGYEK